MVKKIKDFDSRIVPLTNRLRVLSPFVCGVFVLVLNAWIIEKTSYQLSL